MKKSFFILFCFFIGCQIWAQNQLWQKTQVGMTVTEVQKLYPEAIPVNSAGEVFKNGDEIILWVKLKIEGKMLGTYPFNVSFAFDKEGKLGRVQWTYVNKENNADIFANGAYDKAFASLAAAYGQPDVKKTSDIIKTKSARWFRNGIDIMLSEMVASKNYGVVLINYEPIEQEEL